MEGMGDQPRWASLSSARFQDEIVGCGAFSVARERLLPYHPPEHGRWHFLLWANSLCVCDGWQEKLGSEAKRLCASNQDDELF